MPAMNFIGMPLSKPGPSAEISACKPNSTKDVWLPFGIRHIILVILQQHERLVKDKFATCDHHHKLRGNKGEL